MFAKNKVTQSMLDAVNSVLVEDEKKRLINDAEMDETGFHKAAHAAKKSGQSHFEFQGKKYPVTAKSHKEAIEMDEASLKIPTATGTKVLGGSGYGSKKAHDAQHKNPFEKGPSKKDLKGIKTPSKKELKNIGENSFASKLLNHITENKAANPEDIFTDNNLGEAEMTDKQMKKREKIVLSMKKGEAGFKQRYGKNYKNVMYATATKQAMKEDSSDTWNGSYDFVISEKEEQLYELKARQLPGYQQKKKELIAKAASKLPTKEEVDLEEFDLEEGDASYKKMDPKKPFTKMSDVVDRKKTVKDLMKGRQYFGTGKVKEEVEELDELSKTTLSSYSDKAKAAAKTHKDTGDRYMSDPDERGFAKHEYDKAAKRTAGAAKADKKMKEEVELSEKNDAHNYAAHYEDPKTGEWTGMKLMSAKDDQDAIKQAHANCEDGCRLSKVERHMTVKESVDIETDKNAHKITTDMLRGREPGGKLNSFKNFKVNLTVAGEEDIPKEMDKGEDTKEKQKITTNPGPVDIKLDDKYGSPTPQSHFSTQERITSEEVELTESSLEQFLSQKGIDMKNLSYSSKIAYSKSNEFKKWKMNHQLEATEVPFEKPYKKVDKDVVTDKSGAKHTPHSRARDLARNAMKKLKGETMMGKISN